jgi:phosphoglycolate phosphatase-like HAD superfamily hydrolase
LRTKRYRVELTDDERAELEAMLRRGRAPARRLMRARVLLSAAEDGFDQKTAAAVRCGERTVQRVRQRFVAGGLEAALSERPRPGAERLLDARAEAHLIALACATPPDGRAKWSMQLLADRLVTAGVVEAVSDETVRRTLKRGRSNRG